MGLLTQYIVPHFNFWIYVILMMIGLYAMIAKNNLIKKLIGMSIFQTAIILFYVSLGVKSGASIPILPHDVVHDAVHAGETTNGHEGPGAGGAGEAEGGRHGKAGEIDADGYANPLPHVLMLTAIVVGVATLGVGLAVAQMVYKDFGTLEEDEILKQIKGGEGDD